MPRCAYYGDLSQLSAGSMHPTGCVIRSTIQLSGRRSLVLAQCAKTEVRAATSLRSSATSRGKAPRPCRLETASQLTSSTASERHAPDERPGPLKMSGRAISVEFGMPCGGALEPKLQHAHFCLSTAHQRPATLEPTSRQKPERRAELPYMFTAIVSRGRVRVNSTCIRGLFEFALAAMSADRYANGHISQ